MVRKALLTSIVFFSKLLLEVNGYHQLFGYQHSSKYLLLCSTEGSKSYRFWNDMRVSKLKNSNFWVQLWLLLGNTPYSVQILTGIN